MNEVSILDIISPVMIGPSSSHTAGAVRLGLLAKNIYQKDIKKVKIILYNSYAKTGLGHGSDKGLLAGLLGFRVDDTIIKDIFNSYVASKLDYIFEFEESFTRHPNAVDFIFYNNDNIDLTISAKSVGAGEIEVDKINNFEVNINGKYNSIILILKDTVGEITKVTDIIQRHSVNIASLNCNRKTRGKTGFCCILLDSDINKNIIEEIKKSINPYFIRYVKKLES